MAPGADEVFEGMQKALEEVLEHHRGPSRKVIVPRFIGLSVPEMWALASRAGVHVKISRLSAERPIPGRIVGQSPNAGKKVRRNSVVDLHVTFEPAGNDESKGPFG